MMKNQASAAVGSLLAEYKDAIDEALADFFRQVVTQINLPLSKQSQDALEKIEEYTLRPGKRIRGALACFGYDYAAKTHGAQTGLQAAIALELAQSYMLIVDDVMDKSPLRRGKPTIHEEYLGKEPNQVEDEHTASMLAITVGLLANHLESIVLARISEESTRVQEALRLMHRNLLATGFGQLDDLYQHVDHYVTEADIIRKYELKSSYYTFVNPLQVGLVLGGVQDTAALDEVEQFGLSAGVAFQLHDDLLGVFGSEESTGKLALDDIKEGKNTVLIQHALATTDEARRQILQRALGNADLSLEQFREVQAIVIDSGSKAYVEALAARYAAKAAAVIGKSTFWDEASQQLLSNLVEYSVSRIK